MYPAGELTDLARRKQALRQRIALTRLHCVALAADAARPLHWIDRFVVQWRRIAPFAKLGLLPLLFLLRPGKRRPRGFLSGLLGWLPVVVRTVRSLRGHGNGFSAFGPRAPAAHRFGRG